MKMSAIVSFRVVYLSIGVSAGGSGDANPLQNFWFVKNLGKISKQLGYEAPTLCSNDE